MRPFAFLSLSILLAASGAVAAPVPEHFSERARELLSGGEELNRPEEVVKTNRQLNVIYFVGCDSEPLADYERRLSELLLYLRRFYGEEMARNGFGYRSFELPLRENGDVDVTLIRGSKPAAEYPCTGEAAMDCLKEIDEFFRLHPERKFSRHTFVIMPTRYDEKFNDASPGGVPFFAMGRNCFVLDYNGFDLRYLGQDTEQGRLLTKMFGGLGHELGHCVNLYHNNGPVSELNRLGTPLMGSGNYTFGMKPTYLTKASCAILDVCELVPQPELPKAFYAKPAVPLKKVEPELVYDGENFDLELRLPAEAAELKAVNVYVQDMPSGVNQDYDAVAFVAQRQAVEDGVVFRCRFSAAELAQLKEDHREVAMILIYPNGFSYRWTAQFRVSELKAGQKVALSQAALAEITLPD